MKGTVMDIEHTMSFEDRRDIARRWVIAQDHPAFPKEEERELARWIRSHIDNCKAYIDVVREMRWTPILHVEAVPPLPAEEREFENSPFALTLEREFGLLVQERREELGWSVDELADEAGMEPAKIEAVEEGRTSLLFLSACVVCRALKRSPSRMMAALEKVIRRKYPKATGAQLPGSTSRRRTRKTTRASALSIDSKSRERRVDRSVVLSRDQPRVNLDTIVLSRGRDEALEAGLLIEVSDVASTVGFGLPIAVTRRVWERCVAWSAEAAKGKPIRRRPADESTRLCHVLETALDHAMQPDAAETDRVHFEVTVTPGDDPSGTDRLVHLTLRCGPDDEGDPVLTITTRDEGMN